MNNISKNSCILITGAAGGLGKAVIDKLYEKGFNNLITPSRLELDLLDSTKVVNYFSHYQPSVVLHLASVVYGLQGNLDNQFKALSENTNINGNLFLAISKHPVDYIFFAGTVASYPYPYLNIPLQETDFFKGLPHSGEFGYAMSKRHAYAYLKILSETLGISFTYGVFTNLYGEYDRFNANSGHVIPSLIMKAYLASKSDEILSVWGDGSAQRDFLHFKDAAEAVVICMLSSSKNALINISSGKGVSIGALTELISSVADLKGVDYLIDKPVGIKSRVVDNSLLKALGFEQAVALEQGVPDLYEWYSNNLCGVRV